MTKPSTPIEVSESKWQTVLNAHQAGLITHALTIVEPEVVEYYHAPDGSFAPDERAARFIGSIQMSTPRRFFLAARLIGE